MKKTKMLLLIFILFSITTFVGCEKEDVIHNYAYEVSGSANKYNVTIEAAPKGTAQYSNVTSGWRYTWKQTNYNPRFLYISAQNQNSTGTVIVKIIKNGTVIATNTSSGAYVIATVSGNY